MIIFVWLCCNTLFRMMCWIVLMILNASDIKVSSLLAIALLCWMVMVTKCDVGFTIYCSVPSMVLLYLLYRGNKWKLLIELTSYHLLILKADISTSTQQVNELPCNGSVAFKDLRWSLLNKCFAWNIWRFKFCSTSSRVVELLPWCMEDSLQTAIGRNVYNIGHTFAIGCKAVLYGGFSASHRNPSLIALLTPLKTWFIAGCWYSPIWYKSRERYHICTGSLSFDIDNCHFILG